MVMGLLCNRISVTKRLLYAKPVAWYYLICCISAWGTMLLWRGPRETWLWWAKTLVLGLLSASVLFIDALPIETHAVLGKLGLSIATGVAGVTVVWLKVHTAEMYSEYGPPGTAVTSPWLLEF